MKESEQIRIAIGIIFLMMIAFLFLVLYFGMQPIN